MTNIGIYTPFPSYIGGGERYIMSLANVLQNDFAIDFLSGYTSGYLNLQKPLEIDLSNINFVEYHGGGIKKIICNKFNKNKQSKYDLFLCISNSIFPPVFGIGKKNILIIQFPYSQKIISLTNFASNFKGVTKETIKKILYSDNIKSYNYNSIIAYSEFAKNSIKQKVDEKITIIHPPVEISKTNYKSFIDKQNKIISVGRFIGTKDSKCQLEMVRAFIKMYDTFPELNIEYLCVGGTYPEKIHQDYFKKVKQEAQGYPIQILNDISFKDLIQLYSESKVFWHAKGYGISHKFPEFTEHFGISTVEAMASGCIPIVYGVGGQLEIVQDNYNGFIWKTLDELVDKTVGILSEDNKGIEIATNAYNSSSKYSSENFSEKIKSIVYEYLQN